MSTNGDRYWINRGGLESERLDLQHEFLKKTLGYVLHPKPTLSLSERSRIADVATGTGVVCKDLARTLPSSCELDGFDISDSQFPPVENLPPNVRLQVLDAKGSVPLDMHGKYDIVIIRYLVAAMGEQDWEIVARNAFQMMKPGGWLQWVEADVEQAINLLRGEPELPISNYAQAFAEALRPKFANLAYFRSALTPTLRKEGFSNVTREVTSSDRLPEGRKGAWWVTSPPLQSLWGAIEKAKADDGKSMEYVADAFAKMGDEVETGASYLRYDIHVYIGRKP